MAIKLTRTRTLWVCGACAEFIATGGLLPQDRGYQAGRLQAVLGDLVETLELGETDPEPRPDRCQGCRVLGPGRRFPAHVRDLQDDDPGAWVVEVATGTRSGGDLEWGPQRDPRQLGLPTTPAGATIFPSRDAALAFIDRWQNRWPGVDQRLRAVPWIGA